MRHQQPYRLFTACVFIAFGLSLVGCVSDPPRQISDASVDAGDTSDTTQQGPAAEAALLGDPGTNYLYDIVRRSEDEVYVVGETDGPLLNGLETKGGWDGYIARIGNDSRRSDWLKSVGDETDQGLSSVATSPDGVWVGGVEYREDQVPEGFVTSFSPEGKQGERIELGPKGFNRINNMAAGPDGSVVVAGSGGFAESVSRSGRVGLIGADGTLQWQTTVTGDAQYSGLDVAVSSDRIYLAGDYSTGNDRGSFVRAWNFEGELKLELTIDSTGVAALGGIAVGEDQLYVALEASGQIDGAGPRGDTGGFLLAYSTAGSLQWKRIVDSERRVRFTDLTLDNDRLTVAGWATAQIAPTVEYRGSSDSIALQYDLQGDRLGVWQRGGIGDDWAVAAVSVGTYRTTPKIAANSDDTMLNRVSIDLNGYVYREEGQASRRVHDIAYVNEGYESLDALAFGPQDRLYAFGEASGDYGGGDPNAGRLSGLVARFDGDIEPDQTWAVDGENVAFSDGVITENAIFLAGHAYEGVENYPNYMDWHHPVIVRLSKSGDIAWVQDFSESDAYLRTITGVEMTSSGSIAFIGNTHTMEQDQYIDGPKDGFIGVVGASDGAVSWRKTIAGPGRDELTGLDTDGQGNLLVSGTFTQSFGPLTVDADLTSGYIAQYDVDGNRQWIHQVEDSGWYSTAYGVVAGPDGGVYAAGITTRGAQGWLPIGGDADGYVARFEPSGERTDLWQVGGSNVEFLEGLSVHTDGSFAVVGTTFGDVGDTSNAGGRDGFICIKGSDQSTVSLYRAGSTGADFVNGVTFGPKGSLHITGTVAGSVWGLKYNGGEADAFYARVPASRAVEALDELTAQ